MELNKEELENLTARERLEKLKEIEKEKKKDIEEVEKLIQQSEKDARIEERLKENVEIPEAEPADIGSIFEGEATAEAGQEAVIEEPETGVKYVAESGELGNTYSGLPSEEEAVTKLDLTPLTDTPTEGKKLADTHVGSIAVVEQTKKYQKG